MPTWVTIASCDSGRDPWRVAATGGEPIAVPAEVGLRHALHAGQRLELPQWQAIQREACEQLCFQKLLDLLERRAHSERELKRKLYQRGFRKTPIEAALARARELDLVNDEQFTRAFVDDRLRRGGIGINKLRAELAKRGVDRELVTRVLAETEALDDEAEVVAAAVAAAEPRWRRSRDDDPHKRRARIMRFLAGRGFPADVCRAATDCLEAPPDDDPWS